MIKILYQIKIIIKRIEEKIKKIEVIVMWIKIILMELDLIIRFLVMAIILMNLYKMGDLVNIIFNKIFFYDIKLIKKD